MPSLLIKKPMGRVDEQPLEKAEYSLGRAADCDIVLEGSMISRRHGTLRKQGDSFSIADTGSHNGILVNGDKIEQAVLLKDRDEVQIGNYTLVYYQSGLPTTQEFPTETVTVEEDYENVVAQLNTTVIRRQARPQQEQPDEGALLRQMEKERRTLGLLCDLSRALSSLYSLDDVSRKAIEILLETTQAERGAIFMLEEDQSLRPTMVCDRDGGGAPPGPVPLSSTVAQRILTERKGIITADAAVDPRFATATASCCAACARLPAPR